MLHLSRLFSVPLVFVGIAACNPYGNFPPGEPERASRESADPNIEAVLDDADQQRLLARINGARREQGRPSLLLAHAEPAVITAVRNIRNGADPLPTLRTAMERLAQSDSTQVVGWAVDAADLDQAQFPSALIEREDATAAVVVLRRRSAPRYTIYYLLIEEGMDQDQREG